MSDNTLDMKKEQEREELHRAIWAIADELRGAVDGWDFKSYVLGTMFYRYISENIVDYIDKGEWDAGNPDFSYAKLSDEEAEEARQGLVEEKGFFIRNFSCMRCTEGFFSAFRHPLNLFIEVECRSEGHTIIPSPLF